MPDQSQAADTQRLPDLSEANAITFHPLTLAVAGGLAIAAVWLERRLKTAPEFALGLVIGVLYDRTGNLIGAGLFHSVADFSGTALPFLAYVLVNR